LRREATLPLLIGNSNGQRQLINTIIDTGFDGFLSLPSEMITRLGLPWTISHTATLGDGSQTLFDFYTGTVIWDGVPHDRYCGIRDRTFARNGNALRLSIAG
jgi:predicted aspartyl protease